MKKLFKILSTFLLVFLTAFSVVEASTVLSTPQGGTGTSTVPTKGQVLVGQTNGTYAPQATSTLGISGGGGSFSTTSINGFATTTFRFATTTSGTVFNISTSTSAITFSIPAVWSVSQGGTGTSTLTANRIVIGNGTSSLTSLGAGTSVQLLHGNASGLPTFSSLNAGTDISAGTYVPLVNGGDGFSNAFSSYNLTSGPVRTDNFGYPGSYSNFISIIQSANGDGMTGIVAATPGTKVTFKNDSINPYFFYNQNSNSTASNQFKFPDGQNFTLAAGSVITFVYHQSDSAWEPISTYPCYPDYYLVGNQLGCITASDYNYWNAKQSAISASPNGVLYWNGGVTNDPTNFYWNFNDHLLGIGTNSPQAGADVYPATLSLGTPTLSASLYQIPTTDPITGLSLNQYPEGSGGYSSSGQNFSYDTISEFLVGGIYFYLPPQNQGYTDSSGYPNFYNQLNWSLSSSPDAIFVRQNSPSSILEQISSGASTFVDNNDMSPSGSLGLVMSGYVANGSNLNITYTCWAYRTVGATTIYSGTPSTYTTTDPNDGNSYMPVPSCGGVTGATGYKIQRSSDGQFITTTSGVVVDSPSVSWGASNTVTPTSVVTAAITGHGDVQATAGNLVATDVGYGLQIKEGSNARMGTATLSGGTVTVSNTSITANTRIFLTTDGGTLTHVGSPYVSARSAGTSFTISSSNVLDSANVDWLLVEPN